MGLLTPHALDLLEDGSTFYWSDKSKDAWVIRDLRDSKGNFLQRRVAPKGTDYLLNYSHDDYQVWVDGNSADNTCVTSTPPHTRGNYS